MYDSASTHVPICFFLSISIFISLAKSMYYQIFLTASILMDSWNQLLDYLHPHEHTLQLDDVTISVEV
jgi:hypothetical protein